MQITLMIIIFLLFLLLGILIVSKKKAKYQLLLNNVFWIWISWGGCLGLYFFSGIKYKYELNLYSFLYIIMYWLFFFLGQFLASTKKRFVYQKDEKKAYENEKKINFVPLFLISLYSIVIYIIVLFKNNDGLILGITRDISSNSLMTLLLVLSNCSLIIWLYEISYSILNEQKISVIAIASAVIYNLPVVLLSGRDAMIIFLVSTCICLFYCGSYVKDVLKREGKVYEKIKRILFVFIIVIILYMVFISTNRYGQNVDSAINMFVWTTNCEFPEYLKNLYYRFGGIGKVLLNFVFYYSSQFSKFAIIFDNYEGPYMGGLFQFHYLSRLFPDSWDMSYSLVSNSLYEITKEVGLPGIKGFWETAIGYTIYDFGKIGALIMSFLVGFFVEKINIYCSNNATILKLIFKVVLCVGMFLTVELSPFFDYYYIFPLFWIILLLFKYNSGIREKRKEYQNKFRRII